DRAVAPPSSAAVRRASLARRAESETLSGQPARCRRYNPITTIGGTPMASGMIDVSKEVKTWERLQASATLGFDASGQPVLQVRLGDDLALVGVSRANILSVSESPELAARLLEARLRQELRPATARKTSPSDVEKDLALFPATAPAPAEGSCRHTVVRE